MTLNLPDGTTRTLQPLDDSSRLREIMGDDILTLHYQAPTHANLPLGTTLQYQGQEYTLMRPQTLVMHHTRAFEYTATFEAPAARLKQWRTRNTVDRRLTFPLTARPEEHLQLIIDNLNERDATPWTGQCAITDTERLISYNHTTLREALDQLAQTFSTEWEINGREITLGPVSHNADNPVELQYGRGNGFLPDLQRTNQDDTPPTGVLYVQASDRNINPQQYASRKQLHLPSGGKIRYDGQHFDDEPDFDDDKAQSYYADTDGYRVATLEHPTLEAEDSIDLTDIYPSHTCAVTSLTTVDEAQHFYDIADQDIPADLDYAACQIAGQTMTVAFQSGQLAGREFDIQKYDHATRSFQLVPKEEDGLIMPTTEGGYIPAVGDRFVVYNVMLPTRYILEAERTLLKAAVRHLHTHRQQLYTYAGTLDPIYARQHWAGIAPRLRLGSYIRFLDPRFQPTPVDIRITAIKDYLNQPHRPEITLSNQPVTPGFTSTLQQQQTEATVTQQTETAKLLDIQRRSLHQAEETARLLAAATFDKFTQSLSPVTLHTMQTIVGDQSLQLTFHDDIPPYAVKDPEIAYVNATQKVFARSARVIHHTLGQTDLTAPRSLDDLFYWNIPSDYESQPLDDPHAGYYLYLKANGYDLPSDDQYDTDTMDEEAQYITTTEAHALTEREADGAPYHYFLLAIITPEENGARSLTTVYGYTEILPGQITTERVISADGRSVLNLQDGTLRLGDRFRYDGQDLHIAGHYRRLPTVVTNQNYQQYLDPSDLNRDTLSIDRLGTFVIMQISGLTGKTLTIRMPEATTGGQTSEEYASAMALLGETVIIMNNGTDAVMIDKPSGGYSVVSNEVAFLTLAVGAATFAETTWQTIKKTI